MDVVQHFLVFYFLYFFKKCVVTKREHMVHKMMIYNQQWARCETKAVSEVISSFTHLLFNV